jgi:hypothetical protein
MRHFMRAESVRLLVVAVMPVLWSPSASGQAQGVLRIRHTAGRQRPTAAVALHLLISDNPATARREVVTSRDSSAVVTLRRATTP